MYGWLAKNVQWAGEYRSIDHWKRLTVAAWECIATDPQEPPRFRKAARRALDHIKSRKEA